MTTWPGIGAAAKVSDEISGGGSGTDGVTQANRPANKVVATPRRNHDRVRALIGILQAEQAARHDGGERKPAS
jgi:hypothetical protein